MVAFRGLMVTGPAPLRLALLRGINLGGNRRMSMAELRGIAGELGWTSLATHLQSGNLVFQAAGSDHRLADELTSALAERLGIGVDVVIRDHDRLAALVVAHPFAGGDPAQAVIACCDRGLDDTAIQRLAGLAAGAEQVQLAASGYDVYAVFPDGQARSRLAARLITALSPATGTVRNLRTMTALVDLLRG